MTQSHRVWLETCKGCNPWTRVVVHPSTSEPIVQALHETTCPVWPPVTRGREGALHGQD